MLLKYDALKSHLARSLAPLYVLTGDEQLLVIEAADMIRRAARNGQVTEREVLTVESGFKWDQIHALNHSMSLFGDRKFIEIRIPSGRPDKQGSQALQEYVASLNPDNITLITLPRLDWNAQKSVWVQALKEHAVYVEVPTVDLARLGPWIAERLRRQNQTASPQCIGFLVERVEGNLLAAHQEILKLGLLYPEGELSFEQVSQSVLNVARYDIFKLNTAILSGDAPRFVRMMEGLKGEGEPLPLVLWAFTDEIRTLLKCKMAIDSGNSLQSVAYSLRLRGDRERLVRTALGRLDRKRLERALHEVAQIDRIIKGVRSREWMDDAWDAFTQLGLSLIKG